MDGCGLTGGQRGGGRRGPEPGVTGSSVSGVSRYDLMQSRAYAGSYAFSVFALFGLTLPVLFLW